MIFPNASEFPDLFTSQGALGNSHSHSQPPEFGNPIFYHQVLVCASPASLLGTLLRGTANAFSGSQGPSPARGHSCPSQAPGLGRDGRPVPSTLHNPSSPPEAPTPAAPPTPAPHLTVPVKSRPSVRLHRALCPQCPPGKARRGNADPTPKGEAPFSLGLCLFPLHPPMCSLTLPRLTGWAVLSPLATLLHSNTDTPCPSVLRTHTSKASFHLQAPTDRPTGFLGNPCLPSALSYLCPHHDQLPHHEALREKIPLPAMPSKPSRNFSST